MKLYQAPSIRISPRISKFMLASVFMGALLASGLNIQTTDGLSSKKEAKAVPVESSSTDSTFDTNAPQTDQTNTDGMSPSAPTTTASQPTSTQSVATPAYSPATNTSPRGLNLYVNPSYLQVGRPERIANQPTATWLGGWSGDVRVAADTIVSAASTQNTLAVMVAYNIPVRDCGSYSAGGANSSDYYKTWIRDIAAGIGQRKVVVILEPDALSQITCLNSTDQAARYANLADAVRVLSSQTQAFVYLDAGHSGWIGASDMAGRLKKAGVAEARGFALNVSNFQTTPSSTTYGNQLSNLTGKSFVIDTGRNGNGSNGEWCNPRGRALGASPTTNVGGNTDAYLWVKVPGESDGTCNGGPSAGVWWNDYANELITNAR